MSCCKNNNSNCSKNKENDLDILEDADACSDAKSRNCGSIVDKYITTARSMAILAFLLSWTWWATFAISLIGMVWTQLLLAYSLTQKSIYIAAAVAASPSLVPLGVGLYNLIYWWGYGFGCDVFFNCWENSYDSINCEYWGLVSILCGLFWIAAAFCLVRFVKSGRHAEWGEHNTQNNTAADAAPVDDEPDPVAVEAAFVEASHDGRMETDAVAVQMGTLLVPSTIAVTSELISNGSMIPVKIN